MGQIFEFISNNPLLFVAFFAVLGMILYTEWSRIKGSGTVLSPFAATRLVNSGDALLLDVRGAAEYKTGHVLNAMNVPVGEIDKRLHELTKFKEKDVLVYCDNGMRASRAIARLKKEGFENLNTLGGGLVAWEKASLPVVKQ